MTITKKQKLLVSFKIAVVLLIAFAEMCFGQYTWELINPLPQSKVLNSVTYGNNQFIAVGDSGSILSSSNCTTWTIKNSGTTTRILSVTYGNELFVAVGDTNLTSSDGTTWTIKNSTWVNKSSTPSLFPALYPVSMTFCNNQFVAVDGGSILTSSDGTTFAIKRSYENLPLQTIEFLMSVTYGNGLFMAVGYSEAPDDDYCCTLTPPYKMNAGLIFSSSDGRTWTQKDSGMTFTYYNYFTSVTYGNGVFVAVGSYSGNICSSSDGVAWSQNSVSPNNVFSVTFGNGLFVALSDPGKIFTSPDGATWTQQNSGTNSSLFSVAYGNEYFVAVGDKGTIIISKADASGVALQTSFKSNNNGLKINVDKNCISATLPYSISYSQLKIGLFNVSGKQIYSAIARTQNGILNIPAKGFPTGKYFMSITDGNNRTLNSAFVLAR